MNTKILMLICGFVLLFLPKKNVQADPPIAVNISETIQNYWSNAQFDECKTYVTNLVNTYSNYLPAKVAYATFYLAAFDTDYDVLIQGLSNLVNEVNAQNNSSLNEISDLLEHELSDRILQKNVFVDRKGYTVDQIKEIRATTNVWTENEGSWPNLHLISLCPDVELGGE